MLLCFILTKAREHRRRFQKHGYFYMMSLKKTQPWVTPHYKSMEEWTAALLPQQQQPRAHAASLTVLVKH